MIDMKIIYGIELVNSIFFILSFFVMLNKLGYRYKVKGMVLNITNIIFIILLIKSEFENFILQKYMIISIILLFLISKISYSFSIKKALSYSILYKLIYTGMRFTVVFTYLFMIDKLNIEQSITNEILQNMIVNMSILLFVASINKLKNLSINKKYYLYITITIIINGLVILFIQNASISIYELYNLVSENNIQINKNILFIPFINFGDLVLPYIIIASNIVFIISLMKLFKFTQEQAKFEILNEKIDMQYNYYLSIKESQEKVRRLYHDINNHMTNIKIIQNQNQKVDEYINSINKEIHDFESTYNTGNIILDIILNEKSRLCKLKDVDLLCNIDFSRCDFIEMIDVSSIFSNLLDNAIEACEKIEDKKLEKYISIRGTILKSYFVIKCENSKINTVISKNNKILTNKKDKYIHGIGIESIKSSIKKYDGELDIQMDANKFTATIYIPLK